MLVRRDAEVSRNSLEGGSRDRYENFLNIIGNSAISRVGKLLARTIAASWQYNFYGKSRCETHLNVPMHDVNNDFSLRGRSNVILIAI